MAWALDYRFNRGHTGWMRIAAVWQLVAERFSTLMVTQDAHGKGWLGLKATQENNSRADFVASRAVAQLRRMYDRDARMLERRGQRDGNRPRRNATPGGKPDDDTMA
eukprot:jgi/Tetstr1/453807/TSEL_040758.t1